MEVYYYKRYSNIGLLHTRIHRAMKLSKEMNIFKYQNIHRLYSGKNILMLLK